MAINEYPLKTGKDDEIRLDALAQVYEKSTVEFLDQIELTNGLCVADYGCGIGNTTQLIAKKVGSNGSVIGIDISKEQLEIANKRFKIIKLSNATLLEHDIYNASQIKQKFDAIYCRLVFLNMNEPEKALKQMLSTLKPNGVIAVEEFVNPTECFCFPRMQSFDDHLIYMKMVNESYNFNVEIGKKLKYYFLKNNIEIISIRIVQPLLDTSQKRSLPSLNVNAQKTNNGFGYDKAVMESELKNLIHDESFLISYYKLIQICGRKKE